MMRSRRDTTIRIKMMNSTAGAAIVGRRSAQMLLCFAAMLAALVLVANARAELTLQPGSLAFDLSTNQAGAHPDVTTSFMFTSTVDNGATVVDGALKDLDVALPAGLVGTPTGIPQCPAPVLGSANGCPADTQVGVITIWFNVGGSVFPGTAGLYNMAPAYGTPAQLGFSVYTYSAMLTATVRATDAGLTLKMRNAGQAIDVMGTTVTVWGVPADPSHDSQRFASRWVMGSPAGVPPRPFMTNPTACTGDPLTARFRFTSWQNAGEELVASDDAPAITGCQHVRFDPTIAVTPTVTQADSPSGYTVELGVPQSTDPHGLATADLRKAVVTLPAGVTLNPSVADGLKACTDEEYGFKADGDPACPDASKLGDATLSTPALSDPLKGSIFLGKPTADDPYRLFIVLQGSGVTIKLRGSVTPDPKTGQLTTTFDDNPQQPFDDFQLRFKAGSRAPLTTPVTCGAATTTSALTPWSSSTAATPTSVFDVSWDGNGAGCPAALPFTPGFSAGVTNPVAGAYSPFVFRVTRDDRNQTLGQITSVHMPAGLTARVTDVPLCDDAAAAAGTCGGGSQVGSALVGSGAGTPLHLGGKVFLTKGYKGAPFGLSIVVPAIAGPFDLGTVVVRAAVKVNPDASLSVDADPLPTMLKGIPLRLRDIALNFDRPGFMLNPTSCDPTSVTAKINAVEGAVADVSSRFQLAGCAGLPFKPRIVATTKAGNSTAKGVALHVTVAGRQGDANLRTVRFTLPAQFGANLNETKNACPEADYAAGKCSALAKVGTAKAVTGILPDPMVGDVYLVAVKGGLPKLGVMLSGNGISIPLTGNVSFVKNRTVTTFDAIPDVPITRFDLDLPMGAQAAITSTSDVCRTKLSAPLRVVGQSGATVDGTVPVKAEGCKLRIAKVSVGSSSVRVSVSGVGAGKLRASGAGLVTTTRTLKSSPSATLVVKLTSGAKAALARAGKLSTKVKVTFSPSGGTPATASKRLRLHR